MVSVKTVRVLLQTANDADRRAVRQHLKEILRDSQFSNSKRYPAFLSFVVERTLDGYGDHLKERTIGIEVFHRPADYDTNNDTVVRYTAGEVRKRLALYHHNHPEAAIEISLPAGSYVPEFYCRTPEETAVDVPEVTPDLSPPALTFLPAPEPARPPSAALPVTTSAAKVEARASHTVRLVATGLAAALILLLAAWFFHRRPTALDRFWGPVVSSTQVPLVVSGGVVFSPNPYSGVETAVRTDEYPFVSMQIAASLARVSALIETRQGKYTILPANSTNLGDLRDRPVILLGAYNNPWTLRLLQDAPLRLGPPASPSIINANKPSEVWQRDRLQPYASSDDYALIARFHDATTGGLVIAIAGLGRNGTEAATQYITDPQSLAQLELRLGHAVDNRNIEVVIRAKVVEGRTGAPALESAITW